MVYAKFSLGSVHSRSSLAFSIAKQQQCLHRQHAKVSVTSWSGTGPFWGTGDEWLSVASTRDVYDECAPKRMSIFWGSNLSQREVKVQTVMPSHAYHDKRAIWKCPPKRKDYLFSHIVHKTSQHA